jgi:hypothetical protein
LDLLVTCTEHTRTRIVEGHTEARPEEIIRSIEWILTKSSEKRRHRKTHGRISFGDLARTIADKWKTVDPQRKAIFDQYAEVDMRRYRTELKLWKEKKEREAEAASKGGSGSLNRTSFNSVNNSFSSVDPNDTDSPIEVPSQQRDRASWQTRNQSSIHESLNSSYVSVDSCESELSLEPMPINAMQMQMQIQMQMQMQLQIQQMQMQKQQRCQQQQQQQQQNYPHVYQQQQANSSQANFIANANQGSMTSFPARGGGYGNTPLNMMAPGKYGNASLNSLAPNDSLLGVSSSQISDYPSSHTSGYTSGNFSSSYALGNWGH